MQLLPDDASSSLPPLSRIQSELARRSLAEFVKKSWHVLERSEALQWGWHVQAICDHVQALLEGRIPKNKLLINVPPGSMKSRIVSVCAPAWWWIDHADWRAIFASANPRVTIRDSVYCRQLIESPWYQESFKPDWTFAADQNAKSLYYTTKGGLRMAVSVNAAITGDRAHALFWDDLLDAKDAQHVSRAKRESVNWWYDVAYANRLANPTTGIICGICQRLHDEDPAGHVLKSGDYEHLNIPQVYEPPKRPKDAPPDAPPPAKPTTAIGWTDPRETPGALMFPQRFSAKYLRSEKKRLGSSMFEAQHQQRPSPLGGKVFHRGWWRFYRKPNGWETMPRDELLKSLGITRVATGWDTALTEDRANDFTSSHTIGEAPARFYVLAHWMQRVDYPDVEREILINFSRWKPHGIPVEGGGSASGKAVVRSLKRSSRAPLLEVNNIAKEVRASLVSPTVEAGLVYLPEDEPWVERFIDSCAAFPKGEHDDDVDSFCIALDWLLHGKTLTQPRAFSA